MGFSSILDISSFFIGMIINLIFVALMCYYFKRKYDYLYEAQCEQSKIIYQLIHKPSTYTPAPSPSMDYTCDPLVNLNCSNSVCDSDSDSDSEEEEFNVELKDDVVEIKEELKVIDLSDSTFHITVEEVQPELEITVNVETEPETQYSKMSMKQLKDVLSSKGIKPKPNSKKDDLIDLITKESATQDLTTSVSIS